MASNQTKYSIPYSAPGNYKGIYTGLRPVRNVDKILEIVNLAKKIAKEAGYPLSGSENNTYTKDGNSYEVEVHVNENDFYYVIDLIPIGMIIKSQNLEIVMVRSTLDVILILKGG